MSKPMLGLIIGAILGMLDGASAWFTPAVRPVILSIVIASTIKGLITGVFAGWVARMTNSMALAIATGLAVGLLLSYLAAAVSPDPSGHHYYFEIMLPGCILGGIAGFASQRMGNRRAAAAMALLLLTIALPSHAAERSFTVEKVVNVTPAEAYAMWTSSADVAKFFAPQSRIDARPGGEFTIIFQPKLDPQGDNFGTHGAHVLAAEPGKHLAFEWTAFVLAPLADGGPPAGTAEDRRQLTRVDLTFAPEGEHATRVKLTHSGFGSGAKWDAAYAYFNHAWPHVLDALAALYAKWPDPVARRSRRRTATSSFPMPRSRRMRSGRIARSTTARRPRTRRRRSCRC
jgi:uncharacterized protein YndB with AHSA1/START domain